MKESTQIVVVGASGYWGSIVTRNALQLFGSERVVAYDINENLLNGLERKLHREQVLARNSHLHKCVNLENALESSDNKFFIIATPPKQHYEITKKVLAHGRHVLVTKPLALSLQHAAELDKLAQQNKCTLMVDHTFLYHPAVKKMLIEIKAGRVGEPKAIYGEWLSRGKIQEVGVIWDLAPHPLSILLELWQFPITIDCKVHDAYNGVPTEVSLFLKEAGTGNSAVLRVSWMDADKRRLFKVRGTHHSIIFDDTLEIPDKLTLKGGKELSHRILSDGYIKPIDNIAYPQSRRISIDWQEPLKIEIQDFIHNAELSSRRNTPRAEADVMCVKLIEAAHRSIETGRPVDVMA